MRIALIDTFFDESHAYWAEGLKKYSSHEILIYSNPPRYWKWQMVGGTMEMAKRIKGEVEKFDLIIVTDMVDLPCFLGYLRNKKLPKVVMYFHENQITYPWSSDDKDIAKERDHHYGFMNLRSAIVSDYVLFNSEYHKSSFLSSLPSFVKKFPTYPWKKDLNNLNGKASVLPIGIDLSLFRERIHRCDCPIFLWNHRWEYDKGPTEFFETLFGLKKEGIGFELIVLGKSHNRKPKIFELAKKRLSNEIIHWGFAANRSDYIALISQANIAMVTSNQDFFGISTVEAIAAGCYPILPNKLAYPEHIPPNSHPDVIYNKGELFEKVKTVIDNKAYAEVNHFQQYLNKYECQQVVKDYDDLFESVND